MDLPRGNRTNKEFWFEHFKAAEVFLGTNKEYCLKHGLNLGTFNAQKNKLGFTKRKKTETSGFSEVRVSPRGSDRTQMHLPDPKWLAEFLKAWGSPL